ncbi:MAG: bifunctional 5,10-methylenetetrahydrofolate dehydrogenase/5,10-methenyltetrahydrofolate cyclohydrolase [Candidatus Omnitrophota bacterium]|nr:MAG: bifunctional 5,10-methylenetetrahydrofolate dehydrogenase/5,10-methenyltetrahydrofolate cyclohydrolase [Candidatus Omnitrophota bacterium]
MSAQLLEGRTIAGKIKEDLKKEIEALSKSKGAVPRLVSIQAGENAASAVYIKSQKKNAENLGIEYMLETLDSNITQDSLLDLIEGLNKDKGVSGIIVQLPLPKGIDHRVVMSAISPEKDAEGMHPENLGRVLLGDATLAPCTASAAMELIKSAGVKLYGKEATIVGHSEIVGKPLSMLLLNKFVTTCVCHIATGERGLLPEHVKHAEILVVAVGKAGLVKGDWIKQGAVVIDVGINRVGDKIVGDVEFDAAKERASFITPVPGGVGPLTVTMLMKNVVAAFKMQHELK